MGGTSLPHWCLARLLLLCGDGTTGCHGRAESERLWAQEVGLLVPRPARGVDLDAWCAAHPVWLRGRRWVVLDTAEPGYIDVPDGTLRPVGQAPVL